MVCSFSKHSNPSSLMEVGAVVMIEEKVCETLIFSRNVEYSTFFVKPIKQERYQFLKALYRLGILLSGKTRENFLR